MRCAALRKRRREAELSRTEPESPREFHKRRLRKYVAASDFDGVLGLLPAAEARGPLELKELILRGRATQLAQEGEGDPVAQAESAYLEALRRDPDCVEALVELGWLYFAVADDAKRALPFLERAIALSESAVAEAERGLSACRQEIEETMP